MEQLMMQHSVRQWRKLEYEVKLSANWGEVTLPMLPLFVTERLESWPEKEIHERTQVCNNPLNFENPNFQLSNQQRDGVMIMFTTRSTRDRSFQFIYQQLTFEELDYPCMMSWDHTQKYFRLLGSCHGLILIHVDEHIYLWNPAIRFCTKVLELDRLNDDDYFIVGLGVLNECLCMTRLDYDKSGVEIFVMKESWIFLYFIRNLEINPSGDFVVPFFVTKMGEIALKTEIDFHDKVIVYNPKNDNMRDILVIEKVTMCYCSPIVNYIESLISPKEYYWSEKLHKQFGKPIWE